MNTYQANSAWQMQGSDPLGPGDEVGAIDVEVVPDDIDQAPDGAGELSDA
jgi:hypothetical protein